MRVGTFGVTSKPREEANASPRVVRAARRDSSEGEYSYYPQADVRTLAVH